VTILEQQLEQYPLTETTRKHYAESIRDFIKFAGQSPLRWTVGTAKRYYDNLLNKREMKVGAANAKMKALRLVLPAARVVELQKAPAKRPATLLLSELDKLRVTTLKGSPIDLRDAAIIELLHLGLKRNAIISASFEELHNITRTQAERPALVNWLMWLSQTGIKSGPLLRSISKAGVVGGAMTENGVYTALRTRAAKAKIKDFTLKSLYPTR
jgi:hypothetical protein